MPAKIWISISIIAVAVIAILLVRDSRISADLVAARAESLAAEKSLQEAKLKAEASQAEFEAMRQEQEEDIRQANLRISELNDTLADRAELIARLKRDNLALDEQLASVIANPPEPLPPDELINFARLLYPDADYSAAEFGGNQEGLQLIQAMASEVELGRRIKAGDRELISEQARQIADLQAVVSEHEAKYASLESLYEQQGRVVTDLYGEAREYQLTLEAKDREIAIYRKKMGYGIRDLLEDAAIALGCFGAGTLYQSARN